MQVLIREGWSGAQDSAFPTGFLRVMLVLLILGTYSE